MGKARVLLFPNENSYLGDWKDRTGLERTGPERTGMQWIGMDGIGSDGKGEGYFPK